MLPLNEREESCFDYINEQLGDDPIIDEDIMTYRIMFQSWKFELQIYDTDLYHRIAQALGIRKLNRLSGIFYYFGVRGTDSTDHWKICLSGSRDQNFLKRYGSQYEIAR